MRFTQEVDRGGRDGGGGDGGRRDEEGGRLTVGGRSEVHTGSGQRRKRWRRRRWRKKR